MEKIISYYYQILDTLLYLLTITSAFHVDPGKTHYIKWKVGFAGVFNIFLIPARNINFDAL